MDERCKGRKCLKEINPEEFPGVYLGIPGKYDSRYGTCHDCQPGFISESAPIEKEAWDNLLPSKLIGEPSSMNRISTIQRQELWGLGIAETEKPKLLQRRR